MPASKLKNLVILILLLCNVFLLILVVPGRLAYEENKDMVMQDSRLNPEKTNKKDINGKTGEIL